MDLLRRWFVRELWQLVPLHDSPNLVNWSVSIKPVKSYFLDRIIGEQGGGQGGFYPVWNFFLWPPSKIQNDPHPLRNGFWPPIRFWAGDVCFFREDIKKFAQKKNFRRLTPAPVLGQRAKTAIKFLGLDPPDPLCFKFLWPPSSKKIFWPPSRNDDLAHLWIEWNNS